MNYKQLLLAFLLLTILLSGCVEEQPPLPQSNTILISQAEEGESNVISFDVTLVDYFTEEEDLSNLGEAFKDLGSEIILSPEFEIYSKPSFLIIESDSDYSPCIPRIPDLMFEMILPLSAEAESTLIEFEEEKVGETIELVPDIACTGFSGFCEECPNYLNENSFFPEEVSLYQSENNFGTYKQIRIYLPLFRHNPTTRETYMIKSAKIKTSYSSNQPLALTEFYTDKTNYDAGTPIKASVELHNTSLETVNNLQAKITLKDRFDNLVGSTSSEEFDILPGEKTIQEVVLKGVSPKKSPYSEIEESLFYVKIEVFDSGGNLLAEDSDRVYVYSGEVTDLSFPKEVKQGEDINFEISFKNRDSSVVGATGKIIVYDDVGFEKGVAYSSALEVQSGSVVKFDVIWNADEFSGDYTAVALVMVTGAEEKTIGPESGSFEIVQK